MSAFLRWLLAVEVLGLACLPLAFSTLRRLPDRGYASAKVLGVLLHGLVLWLGVSLGLLRNDVGGAVLAAAGVAALGLGSLRRPPPGQPGLGRWLRDNVRLVLASEALFLVAFAGWAVVRAHDPAADRTERPMDLLLLSGIHQSRGFPPGDPWLAGFPIGYYYLGHWILNALGMLAGLAPSVSVNLGQACWLALLLSACFGLGYDLVALERPGSRRAPFAAGLLAAASVGLVGNPQGTLDALQRAGLDLGPLARGRLVHNFAPPPEPWWWWRAGRVLEDRGVEGQPVEVIDEFPMFSYVVGDAHAHLLALPVAALALTLALGLYRSTAETGSLRGDGSGGLALAALVVGTLPALNAWDFPTQAAILALAAGLALRQAPGRAVLATAATGAVTAAAAGLCVSLPYLLTAQSQAEGLRLNLASRTPPAQLLLMMGPLLAGVLLLAAPRLGRGTSGLKTIALGLVACLAALALVGSTAALLVALLWLVVLALRPHEPERRGTPFALLLALVGLALVLVPELLYVKDVFGTRMNTVFKLYYQAWLLLGLAAACGVALSWNGGSWLRASGLAGLVLILSGLVYTGAAARSVMGDPAGLDALAYVARTAPDEAAAIAWIAEHTAPGAIVLQASGGSYAAQDDRVSVATGRPTLLGWEGHELQWRGSAYAAMAAGRAEAIEAVYRGADADALARTLSDWHIDYVFVGPSERRRFGLGPEREALLGHVMERVFSRGDVRLYRRRAG